MQAAEEVGHRTAEIAARLSAWGTQSLDGLINAVETVISSDDKGRALEELSSRLFETIPGFTITGRIRTQTEEIDISVLNGSNEPRLHREAAVILVECKNWTSKCGKNEFVIFRQKLENRHRQRQRLAFICLDGSPRSHSGGAATGLNLAPLTTTWSASWKLRSKVRSAMPL